MNLKVLWTIANTMGTVSDLKMLKSAEGLNIDTITADSLDKEGAAYCVTGKRYIIPDGSSSEYIGRIAEICSMENITTIIPQKGSELVPLSRNIDYLGAMGVKVLVTGDTDKLMTANDKGLLYEFFSGYSFIPVHEIVHNLAEIEKAVYTLGYPDVPVCIKPLSGEGGKGFRIITEERVNIFSHASMSPKIRWQFMKQYLQSMDEIPELMVSEYLPGVEYSVDCVCLEGKTYICIPRQRLETSMGAATVSIAEKNDEIIEMSKQIISRLNLSYNVNIQFKYSAEGQPRLIEINPRVSGALITNYGAGVNMLEKSLKLAYGIPLGGIDIKWGTRMIRYWDQVFMMD